MILPIFIDTQYIAEQFESITQPQIDAMLDNLAKGLALGYARQLEIEAQNALHQTRKRYIDNIRIIDTGKLEGTVLLDYSKDKMIQMIEEGATPFDMKEGFFNSSKVKFTKDGRKYLTIPFRWGTPGIAGDSGVFTGIMPSSIYKAIKNKVQNKPVSGGGVRSEGLKLNEIPKKYQLPRTRDTIVSDETGQIYEAYTHKTALYQGISKYKDSVTGQNKYNSFRRVSEHDENIHGEPMGSDPNSWIFPGLDAKNLITVALNNFNQEQALSQGLDIELSKLGFGND